MPQVFAHGQLRLYLLGLLESGPKHGYELITALSDRFGGTYRPSPGTIYPRLARLEEEGLVRRVDDGRKGTYTLTEAGMRELRERSADLAALEEGIAESVRSLAAQVRDDVRGSMAGLRADLAAAAQQARASAAPATGSADPRAASRARRAEAEHLLQRFREELRADLRRADARDGIEALTLDTLRTVLESARTAVRATLR
ncbi:PadR family transcriptional regulator [Cellulomonas sp. P24]|uniref:PadR family transcriptional regulator n=1 Tax=Cellulomonas sp. P24 TaxID=2885206 RepID=UPI00216B2748|nr:PadR family transcriptional regulator [Cellulomonas sp. P24]MCR6491675.1 PadR family transcriptional regulator [Cellulomonas sp. P24]